MAACRSDRGGPGSGRPATPGLRLERQDQKTAVLRLQRVLMSVLADQGVDLPIPPDGPVVRMIDQEIVRGEFYSHTPVDGTPEQKRKARRQQFLRALAWAEERRLIGVEEIDGVTYLRLIHPDPEVHDEEEFDPRAQGKSRSEAVHTSRPHFYSHCSGLECDVKCGRPLSR